MAAIEAHAIEVMVGEIEREACGVLEADGFLARIHVAHGAREHAVALEHGVGKNRLHAALRVRKRDFKRLGLVVLRIERGQTFECGLALLDLIALIPELDNIRAVFEHDLERRNAEIAVAVRRKLLRHDIERECALVLIRRRLRRIRAVERRPQSAATELVQRAAEILMQQILAALDLDDVAVTVVLQMEDLGCFIESNHDRLLFMLHSITKQISSIAECFEIGSLPLRGRGTALAVVGVSKVVRESKSDCAVEDPPLAISSTAQSSKPLQPTFDTPPVTLRVPAPSGKGPPHKATLGKR